MTDKPAFLGVERSLTGRRWVGPAPETERAAEAIAQAADLPRPVAMVLAERGVPPHEARAFLDPKLRDLLPDPTSLRDMDRAASRLARAITRRERIALFTDYDVDGAASAAQVIDFLRPFGITPTLYVPDRIDEGYGPNPAAMTDLAARHDLILTLDCGTLAHDAIAAAQAADVIVIDHHQGGEMLPPALAVVNPNRQDETGALGHLAAAGVVFLFLVRVRRLLAEAGHAGAPDLMSLLDLVALATVADVVPLVGVNRAFVRQGLKVMARRERPGLAALADAAGLNEPPDAWHLGFVLGPRINAGGRIGKADLGTRLLATRNRAEAEAIAAKLEALNAERREIEARIRAEAESAIEAKGATDGPLVWAAGKGWHPGVLGIVAARIKERFNRPSVILADDGTTATGSARSVAGIDIGAAIARLAHEKLILKGGGHRMAAGLTVESSRLEAAMARLGTLLSRQGAAALGPGEIRVSGLVLPGAASTALVEEITRAGPFGAAAPAPRFALPAAAILDVRPMGENHLRLRAGEGGHGIDIVAFGAFDSALGQTLTTRRDERFHLLGRLEIDSWGGRRKVRLRLEDAAPAHD